MPIPSRDPRLEDYLNDKFQSLADLDTVDSLLDAVQNQQELLRAQLEQADAKIAETTEAWTTHSQRLDSEIAQFRSQSTHIDRRLQASIQSETSQLVSADFQASIEKLQRLDVAKAYIAAWIEFEALAAKTRELVEKEPGAAVGPLNEYRRAAKSLEGRNEEAEEAAVQLTYHVRESYRALWRDVEAKLSKRFKEVLSSMGWPKAEIVLGEKREAFASAFESLLQLEDVSVEENKKQAKDALSVHPHPVLLPYRDLVAPLEIRFRFHFDGDKPTNKPDKPEWFLRHITDLVGTYAPFLQDEIQPLHSNETTIGRDAIHEFITALLPVVRKKINHLLPVIAGNARLLSHFYHELIKFDTTLREDYLYAPHGSDGEWKGLTAEVLALDSDGGFDSWLAVERDFAMERYQEITSLPNAWHLDYDSVSPGVAKPTKSAIRLRELIENITETYRPLPSFSQRLRFLMSIQIEVLDQYHIRLHGSVEAFKVLTSSIARTVQGMSKEDIKSVEGIGGLERLCRVAGSAAFLESAMGDWGEDLLFLELWEELAQRTSRAKKTSPANVSDPNVTAELTVDEIADKTSQSLADNTADEGALFDELMTAYSNLRQRVEKMISEFVLNTAKDELRAYLKVTSWPLTTADPSAPINVSEMTITPELGSLFEPVASQLNFLHRAMSAAAFLRAAREVALGIQTYIWDYVLMRYQFSYQGGVQFQRDVLELEECFKEFLGPTVQAGGEGAGTVLRKLDEAARLLTLRKEGQLGLKKVVEALFEDNERAREILAKLEIRELNAGMARSLLQRRTDAWD